MDKSSMIVGAALGSTIVLIVFAFVIIPPDIPSKELIVSNGNDEKIENIFRQSV